MDEAYKFARGEEVTSSTGLKTKLARPLDFLVIADHSDGMGLFPAIVNKLVPLGSGYCEDHSSIQLLDGL